MQLEQSSFFIYKALIDKIPRIIFIGIILLLSITIMGEFFFVLSRSPNPSFKNCLESYYDRTHPNVQNYINKIIIDDKNISSENVTDTYSFTNSSTLLNIYIVDEE